MMAEVRGQASGAASLRLQPAMHNDSGLKFGQAVGERRGAAGGNRGSRRAAGDRDRRRSGGARGGRPRKPTRRPRTTRPAVSAGRGATGEIGTAHVQRGAVAHAASAGEGGGQPRPPGRGRGPFRKGGLADAPALCRRSRCPPASHRMIAEGPRRSSAGPPGASWSRSSCFWATRRSTPRSGTSARNRISFMRRTTGSS